jgi:lipopolysaccharide transport system ATP-binding protein
MTVAAPTRPLRLRFDGVWKRYPRWTPGARTLRAVFSRRLPLLVRAQEHLWALRDVSIDLAAGEAAGLIGHNGAGKSTALRLASGVGRPTRGQVLVPDDTASVLSLGELFDLELSGRDNAITAALATGMRRREALARLDDILAFAEIEGFEEAPLRTYSDGMRLRLAFGVIAQLEPDLLLVDEVIAVGDLGFQRRCMDRIAELRERGCAVLLASHSLEQVAEECERAVWMERGRVRAQGAADEVIELYRTAMHDETRARTPEPGDDEAPTGGLELGRNRFGSQEAVIGDVDIAGADGLPAGEIAVGAGLTVSLTVAPVAGALDDPVVGCTVTRVADELTCYDTSTDGEGLALGRVVDPVAVRLRFDELTLLPGEYWVDVGVYPSDWEYAYDYHWRAYGFRVTGSGHDNGVFRPSHRWELDGARTASGSRRAPPPATR